MGVTTYGGNGGAYVLGGMGVPTYRGGEGGVPTSRGNGVAYI